VLPGDDAADTVPTLPRDSLPVEGTVVADRYRLHSVLGEGGMGTVYRAEDLHLDDWVALKALHRRVAHVSGVLERFRREVKLARRVTHENVARVYELGRDGELHFLTMELIDGAPLSRSMRGRFEPRTAGPIVRGIASALDAAHAASVIHRDIKPDNVMLSSRGRVVVTDFGIARSLAAMRETSAGLIGTPAYMAPEQIEGGEITSKTDLYAFGVLIFQMLTGRLPWLGESPMAIAIARLKERPPDPRTIVPQIEPAVADVVLRCLERDPTRRPASAQEIAEPFSMGGTTDLRPLAPSGAALPARTRVAVLPFQGEDLIAGLLTQDVIDSLSQVQSLRVLSRRMTDGVAGKPLVEVASALSVDRLVEGSVREDEGGYRVTARLIDGATGEQLHTERCEVGRSALISAGDRMAVRIAEAMHVAPPSLGPYQELTPVAFELYLAARQYYRGFNTATAIDLLGKAAVLMPDHPLLLSALVVARVRHLYVHRVVDPRDLSWALDAAARAVQAAPELTEPRVALALARLHAGDLPGMVTALREAIARSPSNAEALAALGELLFEVGRVPEGVRRLELAISLDGSLTTPRWVLARHRAILGDFEGALETMAGVMARTNDPRMATPQARLCLWRRDVEGVKRFGKILEAQTGDKSIFTLYPIRTVLGEEPIEATLAHVHALANQPGASFRLVMTVHQVMAEIAAFLGRTDLVLSEVGRAVDRGLIDVTWADRCPLLEEARKQREWRALRERIVVHAEAIIDAVW
jgi:eukaryotic-like serine/threonine-protein kinase